MSERQITMPVGVVLRRSPGVTRWARWAWKAVAVLPGVGPADWKELRRDGDTVDYHAGTVPLTLWRTDTEAYLVALSARPPAVFAVLRPTGEAERPYDLHAVTASAYEAQDYGDNGEDVVEAVPMPEGLEAWVREFVDTHHRDEAFVKRRRDRVDIDRKDEGKGDPRIRQVADVYRSPQSRRKADS